MIITAVRHACLAAMVFVAVAAPEARAQSALFPSVSATYLSTEQQRAAVAAVAAMPPGARDGGQILNLLPLSQSGSFAQYVLAQRAALPTLSALMGTIDALRLNKMIANAPGSGGTSLVSRVAAPAFVGAAVEYGSILQEQTDTATTLRGNALGVAQLLFGSARYQYCPEVTSGSCPANARFLRRLSGSVSFETQTERTTGDTSARRIEALVGDDYRVAAWTARLDLTPSNNLDDPGYATNWREAIDALQADPASARLLQSLVELFRPYVSNSNSIYSTWSDETIDALQDASAAEFPALLERRVRGLVARLETEEPEFPERMAAVVQAYQRYYDVRDTLLRSAQAHKSSLEFVNHRPAAQPHFSRVRYIYSHQPTAAPAVIAVNAGLGVYDDSHAAADRLRDVQLALQVDRRLATVANVAAPTLTLSIYYQWMKADALVTTGETDALPGTAIALTDTAAPLLRTKGHIGAAQAKLTLTLGEAMKVPLSVTWATRTELIAEREVRGQVGFTFDLDQLLH